MAAGLAALNGCMNTALIATSHISGTGIVEILVGLAVAATLALFFVVDPKRHH